MLSIRCTKTKYIPPQSNGSSSVSNCDTTSSITYNNTIKSIFDNHCISCHNASNMSGGFALDTYSGAVNCANSGRLLGAIKQLPGYIPMPLSSNKLSDCDIAKVQRWINTGKPN